MTVAREIHVAVGVLRRGDRVLIARRPDHVHQGGLLEFPGGKVEAGETVQQALVREIREETGVRITPDSLEPVIGIRHDYGDKRVFLDVWETSSLTENPEGREGQEIHWHAIRDLVDADFPAANRPIIRALRLPHQYAITGSAADPDDYLTRLAATWPAEPGLCLLRAPELSSEAYARLAAGSLELRGEGTAALMLHGAPALLERFPAVAGLHLPWHEARRFSARPVADHYLLAVSCHDKKEIAHAGRLQADFITLGPVNPTASHPGAPGMGWSRFRDLVANAPMPVYGLGGLAASDLAEARRSGAQGIAGISFWWPPA